MQQEGQSPETRARKKGLGRRTFLKGLGVMGAAVAVSTVGCVPKAAKGKRYGMVVDLRKCFGCHGCSVACKAQQEVPLGVWRSWVDVSERGTYPNVERNFLPVLCNHCETPPCVPVCPADATHKRQDGIVFVEEDKCIACGRCVEACPYTMRYLNPVSGLAQKCDFCVERVDQGLVPACVNTCNARARIFGDLNDPDSDAAKLLKQHPEAKGLAPEFGTEPNVYYIGLKTTDYQPTQPSEQASAGKQQQSVTSLA